MSDERKNRIIQETKEVGNISAVAKKHGVPVTTVHGWIKKAARSNSGDVRSKEKKPEDRAKIKRLEKELAYHKLEIEILKELLKKTNHAWLGE